jgi:phosphoribosylanthranilate isomerase
MPLVVPAGPSGPSLVKRPGGVRVRAKICGLTRPEDVSASVAAGADALGFVFFDQSPRALTPDRMPALLAAVPAFVQVVGLFVNPARNWVETVLSEVPLDLLQFHGDESPEFCASFARPYIKAVRVRPGLDLLHYCDRHANARGLLLDAFQPGVWGGTGVAFDWSLVPAGLTLPLILSGGLNQDTVGEAIAAVRPYAVDVSSGVESSKGIKDASRIQAFMNGVRKHENI